MKRRTYLFAFVAICIASQSIAGVMGDDKVHDKQLFIGVDVGLSWVKLAHVAQITNGSGFPGALGFDSYTISNPNSTAMLSIFTGISQQLTYSWLQKISLALRYRYFKRQAVTGDVIQFSMPVFNNYRYSVDIFSHDLSALTKLNLWQNGIFSPYVLASLGIIKNHVGSYQEVAKPAITARVSPGFRNMSHILPSYGFGLGLDMALSSHWIASIGYEYQHLNRFVSFGGINTWLWDNLSLGKGHSDAALFSLTYHVPA
jgi:opacity protein-like surface antigen